MQALRAYYRYDSDDAHMIAGQGSLRIGRIVPSPFHDGTITNWFHAPCLFKKERTASAKLVKMPGHDALQGI